MSTMEWVAITLLSGYAFFWVQERLNPRQVRLLVGMAILSPPLAGAYMFITYDSGYDVIEAVTIGLWFVVVSQDLSRAFRQITMIPSQYGLVLADKDHEKAVMIASRESLKDILGPEDLTGR